LFLLSFPKLIILPSPVLVVNYSKTAETLIQINFSVNRIVARPGLLCQKSVKTKPRQHKTDTGDRDAMLTRRQLLRTGAAAGAALSVPWAIRRAYPFAQSPTNIRKFVVNLPGLGPAGANQIGQYIPLATKTTTNFAGLSTDVYRLGVKQFGEKMHPDLKKATQFWGYYDLATGDQKYLAGVIVAKRGTPVLLNITNQLPNKALIPVDPTIMASATKIVGQLPLNRIATHLHGGFTPWFSDGTPFQWFTPSGQHGDSFMNVPGTSPPAGTATYYYPMNQSARFVWYHDHAMGITRTNAYSGIASALIITDDFEIGLVNSGLLPGLASALDIPLVIQDKTFVPSNILTQDPTWQWGGESDLWYPHVYEPNQTGGTGPNPSCAPNPKGRWDYGPCASPPAVLPGPGPSFYTLPTPASMVAEAFFDTILVNGGVYPVVTVPPQRVRFRMLNGSQARFYHLYLSPEDTPSQPGEIQFDVDGNPVPGPVMYQIGTEGGFLPAVAPHNNTTPPPLVDNDLETFNPDGPFNLLLAPAERADVVIDFNGQGGKTFILYNDAPAPFPSGDSRNDYFTGDPNQTAIGGAPTTSQGFGPNTRTLLKFIVTGSATTMGDSLSTTDWLAAMNTALGKNFTTGNGGVPPQQPPLLAPFNPVTGQFEVPAGVPILNKTLNEDFDEFGRLLQRAGTDQAFTNNQGLTTFGRDYVSAVTENPSAGEKQAWDFYNTTGDTHPWHFHLVNVQIVGRGIFDTTSDGLPIFGSFTDLSGTAGRLTPPDANEMGWRKRCG
jgi:spore coat protein A